MATGARGTWTSSPTPLSQQQEPGPTARALRFRATLGRRGLLRGLDAVEQVLELHSVEQAVELDPWSKGSRCSNLGHGGRCADGRALGLRLRGCDQEARRGGGARDGALGHAAAPCRRLLDRPGQPPQSAAAAAVSRGLPIPLRRLIAGLGRGVDDLCRCGETRGTAARARPRVVRRERDPPLCVAAALNRRGRWMTDGEARPTRIRG